LKYYTLTYTENIPNITSVVIGCPRWRQEVKLDSL